MDSPPGLIAVPLAKGCVLVLTEREYLAGIRRGKWWRRRQAMLQRLPEPSQIATDSPHSGKLHGIPGQKTADR
jgi:hypothetical protein